MVITRYDWTRHRTIPVAVFKEKADADAELERLKAEEVEIRAKERRATGGRSPGRTAGRWSGGGDRLLRHTIPGARPAP